MGDFKQGGGRRFGGGQGGGFGRRDGGGGGRSFSGKSWGGSGDRDRGPVTMHQAVCDQCGKTCEVPFRPTDGKPVYCNVCFEGKRETGNNRGGDRFSKNNFDSYKAPTGTGFSSNISKGNNDEVKKQLELLNAKMDRLIKAVEIMANAKSLVAEEKAEEEEKTVPVAKVKKIVKSVSKKKSK
ncbi:MAG: hypothetical protein A2390_03240 [Candidatus Liptonbacteria bacterium RIFOXYB1_FULL_36_10]|uniref:CxxC-x17-CxxC domain-containing protein n=1 Tax=Candidatus Liptonbacteria bacterium RIFOXYB1_FULL_36_10 TaxID=1798654 RepID=A0A1G2CSL1_9BACT|nr:MAG: hypothetical protein A2390_03240 [Candidatus Liptonbacteria bacterium RIFOXYB1_FULL_36_10]